MGDETSMTLVVVPNEDGYSTTADISKEPNLRLFDVSVQIYLRSRYPRPVRNDCH